MTGARAAHWQACLDRLQASGRLPSVVAGVLARGELVWTGVSGDGAVDRAYRIGSITKTLTAVAVLRLRDEGRLSLDDRLGRFVPESGYADATLRMLLDHTSGLPSEPAGAWWERSPGVEFAALNAANDATRAVAHPGSYFHYSNLGYALLGEVVARLRGATWWEVVSREILGPLGMSQTTYDAPERCAQGYSVDHFAGTLTREPHQHTGAMAPAGQLWSAIGDLARWAAFLVEGHPGVLDQTSLREMTGPASGGYGLGLRRVVAATRVLVGHTGSMPGFLASVFMDPADGAGVVLLANATTGIEPEAVAPLFLGPTAVEPSEPWVPSRAVPEVVGPALGLWFWGHSAVELRWHNGRLRLSSLALGRVTDEFGLEDGRLVGVSGYHRGETLDVVRRADGSLRHLECATFVYTRTPYDPDAPVPGGHPGR